MPEGEQSPAPAWQCDLGNGEFDHDWRIVEDGDGMQTWAFRRCRACGTEDHETVVERDSDPDLDA